MHKHLFKKQIVFFIVVFYFFIYQSAIYGSGRILITDHFNFNFEQPEINTTIAIAKKIESYHKIITSFLEFEPLDKITVYIKPGITTQNFLTDDNKNYNQFIIPAEFNFYGLNNNLFHEMFILYLKKIPGSGRIASLMNENLLYSIINYSNTDSNFLTHIINDLVNNMGITSVKLSEIDKYNTSEQKVIYTAFIDFVISAYGKHIFLQSLKDIEYYYSFFNSLGMITGNAINLIEKNFNAYLQKKKTSTINQYKSYKLQIADYSDSINIAFSVSPDNSLALLQSVKDNFRIVIVKNGNNRNIELIKSKNNTFFKHLLFINQNLLAVTELTDNGSIIYFYDLNFNTIIKKILFESLFVTHLNKIDESKIIFSALCGMDSDIYLLNIATNELNILTDSGLYSSPVLLNNSIYCISETDKYSIVELDLKSGEHRTVFSTDQKITYLNPSSDGKLLFSLNMNGLSSIFMINTLGENFFQITKDNNDNITPYYADDKIYFFSYFKNNFQLLFTELIN